MLADNMVRAIIVKLPKGKKSGELKIDPFESMGLCKIKNKANSNLIHITCDMKGITGIVIKGDEIDFGSLPVTSDIGWKEWDISGTSSKFPAIKISGLGQPTNDALIVELIQRLGQILESSNLITHEQICQVILKAMAEGYDSGELMSESSCKGLYGELVFLKKLVDYSRKKHPKKDISGLITRWTGPNNNLRDFATSQMFLEVKTTGNKERVHEINNYRQLIATSEGQGYLYSVSARWDESGNAKHFVDLINQLRGDFRRNGSEQLFIDKLQNYGGKKAGYFTVHEPAYRRMRGFVTQFDGEIFKISLASHEIIDDTSWGAKPKKDPKDPVEFRKKPKYVRGISYELDLNSASFLSGSEFNDLLEQFL